MTGPEDDSTDSLAAAVERAIERDAAHPARTSARELPELLAEAGWELAFACGEARRGAGDAAGAAAAFDVAAGVAGDLAWQPAVAAAAAYLNASDAGRALELAGRAYERWPTVPEVALGWCEALSRAGRDAEVAEVARRATAGLVPETTSRPDPACLPWDLAGMVARTRAAAGPAKFEPALDATTELAIAAAELTQEAPVAWAYLVAAVARAPGLPAGWRVAGRVLDRLGFAEDAWRALAVAGSLDPGDPAVAEELARHHCARGAYARARRALARTGQKELAPETTRQLACVAAWVELEAGRPRAALAHLKDVPRTDPHVEALEARAHLLRGARRRAAKAFEKLAAACADPRTRGALLASAGAARAGGTRELRLYERALALDPHLATAQVNAARALVEAGQGAPARELLEMLPASAGAAEHAQAGAVWSALGDHARARAALEHAVAAEPWQPAHGHALALALVRAGDAAAARELLEGLSRGADPVKAHLALARLERMVEPRPADPAPRASSLEPHAERARLDAALGEAPRDLRARVARASLHLAVGEAGAAISLLAHVRTGPGSEDDSRPEPAPGFRRALRAAAAYDLALARLAQDDAAGARRAIARAVRLAPRDAGARILQALLLIKSGLWDRARRALGAARRAVPESTGVRALSAVLAALTGRIGQALKLAKGLPEPLRAQLDGRGGPAGLVNAALVMGLQGGAAPLLIEAISAGLGHPAAFVWLAQALEAGGDRAGAEAALAAGLEVRPDSALVHAARGDARGAEERRVPGATGYRHALAPRALTAARGRHVRIGAGVDHYAPAPRDPGLASTWIDWVGLMDALLALPDEGAVDSRG